MTQQKSISSKSRFLSHSLFLCINHSSYFHNKALCQVRGMEKSCIKFGGLINLHNKLLKPWRIKERKRINSVVLSLKLEERASVHLV